MTTTPDRKDLGSRLERLERNVRNLQRRSTLSSASISGGNLTVRDGGNIRIIEGGNLIGEGGGRLDWEGDAHFGGSTDIGGDLHISGDTVIDGDTELGGNLTFAPGVIPPEALSRRTEARTFGNTGTAGSGGAEVNSYSMNTTVSVPSWAETTSVIAMSTARVSGTDDAVRFSARTAIDGDFGPFTFGIVYVNEQSIPSVHRRDFTPAGGSTFNVNISGGLSPVTFTGLFEMVTTVMCVFTN